MLPVPVGTGPDPAAGPAPLALRVPLTPLAPGELSWLRSFGVFVVLLG